MDKLAQTTLQITVRAVKGPAKFLSVPGQPDWTDQNHFSPPQQETVTLTVPLFSVLVTYTWPMTAAAEEVSAATSGEIPLQFRLAAVCIVYLYVAMATVVHQICPIAPL